jgi:hypothetical protein
MAAVIAGSTLGAGFVMTAPASAMPLVTVHSDGVPLVKVRDGCGHGWHLNRRGHCRPNHRHRPYRYGWYQPYYYREWHRPHYRHWRHHEYRRHHHDHGHWRR